MNSAVVDPVLGKLVLDRGLNWYEGQLNIEGQGTAHIGISLDDVPIPEEAIQRAGVLVPLILASILQAKEFACARLRSLKNESWLEASEKPVTPEDFVQRLSVESLVVYADQSCEIYFKDGDLFWGHTVLVSWNPEEGFHDAGIAG
jgi:hypothetical protein